VYTTTGLTITAASPAAVGAVIQIGSVHYFCSQIAYNLGGYFVVNATYTIQANGYFVSPTLNYGSSLLK
jgi:hypothetical protein